jgi:hypothetical protein
LGFEEPPTYRGCEEAIRLSIKNNNPFQRYFEELQRRIRLFINRPTPGNPI